MEGVINPGAERAARIRGAVTRHLSNAAATWRGGVSFGVIFAQRSGGEWVPGSPISAVCCTVSLLVHLCPGIADGESGLTVDGVAYRVASPVVPDVSGWAKLDVVEE